MIVPELALVCSASLAYDHTEKKKQIKTLIHL